MFPLCACPEHGKYLSLDLGGTNFRALLVDLKKGSNPNSRLNHKIYTIPPEIMQSSGEEVRLFRETAEPIYIQSKCLMTSSVCIQLFDYLAQCIGDFLDYMGMKNAKLPAGFTFSFPCEKTAINTVSVNGESLELMKTNKQTLV